MYLNIMLRVIFTSRATWDQLIEHQTLLSKIHPFVLSPSFSHADLYPLTDPSDVGVFAVCLSQHKVPCCGFQVHAWQSGSSKHSWAENFYP